MRSHYDFTGGVRGRYARQYAEGTNVVVLDSDVARLFPNREAVNDTPRAILDQKKTRVSPAEDSLRSNCFKRSNRRGPKIVLELLERLEQLERLEPLID